MRREITQWHSPVLNKEMPVVTYGHYGFALLLVPTAGADFLEYERFKLIDDIAPFINEGKVKVYSINSENNNSWMNKSIPAHDASRRHEEWNHYVYNEVVPFIKTTSSPDTPIIISGASFGALHSMNLFLKRPDLLNGVIAMSGVYDLTYYTNGYMDEYVYFNSPQHYIPNLTDQNIINQINKSDHIHILTGSGPYEDPRAGGEFAKLLFDKGIFYDFDNWGSNYPHDWPTWKAMLPHYLRARF